MRKGQMLVELLVGMALTALLMPAMITAFFAVRGGTGDQENRTNAIARVREGVEVLRILKANDWVNVETNGIYQLTESGGIWGMAPGEQNLGNLTRRIEISDAYRDASGKLTSSGIQDPSTKKVNVRVSWPSGLLSKHEETEFYLMRLENLAYIQTTVPDFEGGETTGTAVTSTGGGAVTLGAGGGGNWCDPGLSMTAYDLPKSGAANAISAIEGRIFAGTGDNASGVSFANLAVTAGDPPAVTLLGTFDGYKTNDVFGESGYAYIATDTNSKELVIVGLSTNPYQEVGYYDIPGSTDGESIYVSGNVGYVLAANKLYTFNLTAKTGSRPGLGSVTLAGNGRSVYVSNGYAYVVNDSTGAEFQIIDVSNPSSMSVRSTLNLSGQRGVDVYSNQTGTRAFAVTARSDAQPEFFVINTENKSAPSQIGSYDTGAMDPKGLRVATFNRAIVVGYGGTEYQIVDISVENSPAPCGTGLNIDVGIRDIDTVFTSSSAYSYVVTGDATQELRIIEGGPGGQYATEGVYESEIFDASHSAVFNRVEMIENIPNQTDIRYQVAIASEVSGSCTGVSYEYMGPDMTSSTFFTESGPIPLGIAGNYTNPGRCMRYKAYLSTNEGTVAPELLSITFNYSP